MEEQGIQIQQIEELSNLHRNKALNGEELALAIDRVLFQRTAIHPALGASHSEAAGSGRLDIVDGLQELEKLHSGHALSDQEFAIAKGRLLDVSFSTAAVLKGGKLAPQPAGASAEARQTSTRVAPTDPETVHSREVFSLPVADDSFLSTHQLWRRGGEIRKSLALLVAYPITVALLIPLVFILTARESVPPLPVAPASPSQSTLSPQVGATTENVSVPQYPTAQAQTLQQQVELDRPSVEGLVESWVPQLSATKAALAAGNTVYGYNDILTTYQALKRRYPEVLLLWSGDYSTYDSSDYYVVVVARSYMSGSEAISWCTSRQIGPNDCFAKRLSHTRGPAGSTMYQSR